MSTRGRLALRALWLVSALALTLALLATVPAALAQGGDDIVVQARDALRRKDKAALAAARIAVNAAAHPLAMWVEYWELANRIGEAQQADFDAFAARWSGTYVEDRLRNDWLLELGRRRDWVNLRAEVPHFRMNDDREVTCYALLAQHLGGQDVRTAARAAWLAQRDPDDGCMLLARTLYDDRVFRADDAWHAAQLAVEFGRPRLARAAGALIGNSAARAIGELYDDPVRYLRQRAPPGTTTGHELTLLALMRMAAIDPEFTAGQLEQNYGTSVPMTIAATAWAHAGKQAALRQLPQATDYARKAWQLWDAASRPGTPPPWSDDLLAWQVRAALRRTDSDRQRWPLVLRAVDAMGAVEQRDSAWVYWKARAQQAIAKPGAEGDALRAQARGALESIAPQLSFYGALATEELGGRVTLPPAPAPLSAAEREAARGRAGLTRALQLIGLGLRSEGVREWNYTLRGLPDRDLLAAAQWACEREVYDRCINSSDRTRAEIDIGQRFPTPWREQVQAQARAAGLDPAVLYALIRQESRFVADARSGAGAAGLMQLMPATARWTAKKVGLDFRVEQIAEREVNLQLGAAYFKRVLDDFDGSLALATAAYNAGPNRPRRWREGGAVMEAAAWAESIPFNETRDYVKKVLSNSVYYAALLAAAGPSAAASSAAATADASRTLPTLKARLGSPIGPRAAGTAAPDRELP